MKDVILQAEGLTKQFALEAGFFAKKDKQVFAVNGVSLAIERGKTYGLVGESGCGKTTTARLLVGMYKADSGSVRFFGGGEAVELGSLNRSELCSYREKVKYIFQDPSRSLNPRMSVYQILTSPLKYSSQWRLKSHSAFKAQAREKAARILQEIGLDAADLDRKPSEFSGGQRQRISIARGLILEPDVLICDEVVSALDVSVQAQILNLLQDLRERRGLSFLFIAHDLKVSCYFCDTIGVMYRGVIVEEAAAQELYKEALHPYTKTLFAGALGNFKAQKTGEMKTLLESPTSCPFAHRCPVAKSKCFDQIPDLVAVAPGHKIRCFDV